MENEFEKKKQTNKQITIIDRLVWKIIELRGSEIEGTEFY